MRFPVPPRLLLLAVLIISLSTQPVFLLGAGFVQISEDLDFSITGLGLLTALFFLTASLASPFAGRLVQRIGWRTALRINAIASSSLLLATALFADSPAALGALLVAGAFIYSGSNPAANMTLAEYVDPTRKALIFGLKHAGIPVSTLLAGLAVPLLVVSVGWRWAYGAASLLGLVVLALIPNTPRPPPERRPEDPRRRVTAMPSRRLAGLAGGSALATWAAVALSTYLVAAAVDTGFSEGAAGYLLFGGSLISIAVRIAAGHLTDRMGGRGFGGMVVLTAAGALFFVLIPLASGPAFVVLVLGAFATGWAWPGLMTYSVINANPETVAASSAIAQSGVFIGAGSSPLVLGWVASNWSFDAVWLAVTAALALSSVVVALVSRSAVAAS